MNTKVRNTSFLKKAGLPEPERHRLASDVALGGGIGFGGTLAGRGLQFGLHIVMGRALGTAAYGVYSLAFGVFQLGTQLACLGLQNGLVRYLALYRGKGDTARVHGTLRAAFLLGIGGSVALGCLLFAEAGDISEWGFGSSAVTRPLGLFALALPFAVVATLAASTAQGFKRISQFVLIHNILRPGTILLGVVIAVGVGWRLHGMIAATGVALAVTAVGGILLVLRRSQLGGDGAVVWEATELIRFSLPLLIIDFSGVIMGQADKLIVGHHLEPSQVGAYGAASRVAVQLAAVLAALNLIMAPVISDLHHRGARMELGHIARTVTRWSMTFTAPLFLVVAFYPQTVLRMFGTDFQLGAAALTILAWGYLVSAATGPVGFLLIMSGRQKVELVNIVALAVANVGLNLWLVPQRGIVGAALATALTMALVNLARAVEVRALLGILTCSTSLVRPLAVGVSAFLIPAFLIRWIGGPGGPLAGVVLCPLAYLAAVLRWGLSPEDREVWRALRVRRK